jgi:hypothetical protein
MQGLLPPIHARGPQSGSSGLTVPGQISGSVFIMQGVPLHMMQVSSVTPMLVHWSAGFTKAKEPKAKKANDSNENRNIFLIVCYIEVAI